MPQRSRPCPGAANACSRAARFGVSPNTTCSRAAPFADQIADDYQPGGDADPHLQRNAGGGRELRRRLDQGKAGLHSVLGVMLVSLGIAEIGQHPVTHVLGDEPAGLGDEIGTAAVINSDRLAQILGVEARGECCRAHQIAEHHGELVAP